MDTSNPFSAIDASLGYLYQVRAGLLWSLQRLRRDEAFLVSIESVDDVAFESLGDDPSVLLQTKHHASRTATLTDASPDIWKTLRVWIEGSVGGIVPPHSNLCLVTTGTRKAFEVVQQYEGVKPNLVQPLLPTELQQGLALARNYASLYSACQPTTHIEFGPRFQGCGFLNAAEGDLGIDGTLVEVKTTTRKVAGKDLRQLITYLALDSGAGRQRWSHVAVFNPRRATFHCAEVDALLLRISGGKPRVDVLAELVEFVQATELINDQTF